MDFQTLMGIIVSTLPTLPAPKALLLAEALAPHVANTRRNLTTHEARVQYALTLPTVLDNMARDKKIQAIKELRSAIQASGGSVEDYGLKNCKDVVEDSRIASYSPLYRTRGY